jgi:hypothetical protein
MKEEVSNVQMVEKGVTAFFNGLAKMFVSSIVSATLFPWFGPVGAFSRGGFDMRGLEKRAEGVN